MALGNLTTGPPEVSGKLVLAAGLATVGTIIAMVFGWTALNNRPTEGKTSRPTPTIVAESKVLSGNLDIPFYVWNGEEHHYKKDAPVIFAKPGVQSVFAAYLTSDGKLVHRAEGKLRVIESPGGIIESHEFEVGEEFVIKIGNDPGNKNFFTIPLTLFPGTHLFDLKFGSDVWRVSFQTLSNVLNAVVYNPPGTTSGFQQALESNPDFHTALASLDVLDHTKCRAKQVQSTGFYMLAYNRGVITQGDFVPEGKWVWLLECDITIGDKTESKLIPINPDCLNPQFKREVVPTPVATPQPGVTPTKVPPVSPTPTLRVTPGVAVPFGPVPEGPTWTPTPGREVVIQPTPTATQAVVVVVQIPPSPTIPPAPPATVTPQPATATPNYVPATFPPATNTPGPSPTVCPCPTPQFSPAPSFTPGPPPTPVVTPLPTHTRPAETPVVSATFTMVPWNTPKPGGTATPSF